MEHAMRVGTRSASEQTRIALRIVMAAYMVVMGVLHFVKAPNFVHVMPAGLPMPMLLVYLSGFFEIAGGLGLLVPQVRRFAGLGLIALFVAVFPANIHMALHNVQIPEMPIQPNWALWARLPFQFVFMAWAGWVSKPARNQAA